MDGDSSTDSETGRTGPAEHESIWVATAEGTDYPRLDGDRAVDTVIVGGASWA